VGRLRHHKRHDTFVDSARFDAVAGHQLNGRPVLPKNGGGFLAIGSLYLNTEGLPSTVVRYLKEEGVSSRIPIDINWHLFMAHQYPPGMRRIGTPSFETWLFMRRDYGGSIFQRGCR
jgi:hypothetical protein